MQYKLQISGVLPYWSLLIAVCLLMGQVSAAGRLTGPTFVTDRSTVRGGVSDRSMGYGSAAGLPLLPMPRHAEPGNGSFIFRPGSSPLWIGLDGAAKERLQWHWQRLRELGPPERRGVLGQRGVVDRRGEVLQAGILGKDASFDKLVNEMAANWRDSIGDQGYILVLNKKVCLIAATTETGLFYGLQSLRQLIRAKWDREILVADWPSFPLRMIYDDISRGPISTVNYIKQQIERMAELKLNGLSFYIEHVVQPFSHPDFAPKEGKLTIPQIKELAAYAGKFHMQLTGSFQSFGHFEKILSQPQYASMGATSTLISPVDDGARKFLADVIGELCEAFSGPYFNVNCDETFDLGQGSTQPFVEKMGAAAFYASHLRFLDSVVRSHGKKMMMWGDFVLEHPDVLDVLPSDITYLTWEYGNQSSFKKWIQPFASRHLPFLVCPGVLNTYRMFPDMTMARANIANFAHEGKQQGAEGVMTTIWDDGSAYLFSGDWYGVYVTAESGWSGEMDAFDRRYAITAYGLENRIGGAGANDNYVKALFTLMKLKDLSLTYDLSDRLWHQRLLPDSGKTLIVNNRSSDTALSLLAEAAGSIARCRPQWNKSDIRTLSFAIDQYTLMIHSRLRVAAAAGAYRRAVELSGATGTIGKTVALLTAYIDTIRKLENSYSLLGDRFSQAWKAENQPYWLDSVMRSFTEKRHVLQRLVRGLNRARESALAHRPLPTAASVSLAIREEPFYYFQNWLLAGPFPAAGKEGAVYSKPPIPGEIIMDRNKLYRWKKFFSEDGGIIDLGAAYGGPAGAVVYAYCQINSDTAAVIRIGVESTGAMEIFCNGEEQALSSDVRLPLKAGTNHILFKLHKDKADWSFAFRLRDQLSVTNHKYKYQLNGKNKLYAAD